MIDLNPPCKEEMETALTKLGALVSLYYKEFDDLGLASQLDDLLLDGQKELDKWEDDDSGDDPHGEGDWRNDNGYAE